MRKWLSILAVGVLAGMATPVAVSIAQEPAPPAGTYYVNVVLYDGVDYIVVGQAELLPLACDAVPE